MKIFLYFCLLIIISKKNINTGNSTCFEYSCDECETEEYGKCTKCRNSWTLVNGTCPCYDSNCALCYSGLAGYNLCALCKKGYKIKDNDCYCEINNCEKCDESSCLKCNSGYYYNNISNTCEQQKDEDKTICYDSNCEKCFSGEQGACEYCKNGFVEKKGECIELPKPDQNTSLCPDKYYNYNNICLEICSLIECNELRFNFYTFQFFLTCSSNKCLVCIDDEIKLFNECDNSDECSKIEGCLNCLTSEECVICVQGYFLLGGICIKCLEGCSICSNNKTCDYCMSGYELNSQKLCDLNYKFDYNTTSYSILKEELIEKNYPEEVPKPPKSSILTTFLTPTQTLDIILTTTPKVQSETIIAIPAIITCDINCLKCMRNGECLECEKLFILENNKCIKHCSDENCLNCSLINENEICDQCISGYTPNEEKCTLICSDENCIKCSLSGDIEHCFQCKNGYTLKNDQCLVECQDEYCKTCSVDGKECTECELNKKLVNGRCAIQSNTCSQYFKYCNYCIGNEKCVECYTGYELDINEKKCSKKTNYLTLIFTIIGILISIIGILSYCIYKKRKNELRNEIMRMRYDNQGNNVSIYRNIRSNNHLDVSGSSRSIMSKEDLADEFEIQKRKLEKGKKMCQFCKKKEGKYTCDCGCIVCKEHSMLKKVEGDGENYKVCFACGKIVKKVKANKYQCHICFQEKLAVAHFKCGCALEVCKTCYIKCKMSKNKCPACRAII